MKDEETILLGWDFKYDTANLMEFSVKFRSNYSQNLFVRYIQRGEYRSNLPFDLLWSEDSSDTGDLFLVCQNQPTLLTVSNNPVVSIKRKDKPTKDQLIPSGILFVTSIFKVLEENGYIRPLEDSSLIGRSKGHACLFDPPRLVHNHDIMDFEIPFGICSAENFEIIRRKDANDLVLYDPRHEIFDTRLGISSKAFIPSSVRENEIMERTPRTVLERFERINEMIGNSKSMEFSVSEITTNKSSYFLRPKLVIPGNARLDLNTMNDTSLGDLLLPKIHEDVLDFSIGIGIDSQNLTPEKESTINQFVQLLSGKINASMHSFCFDELPLSHPLTDDSYIMILDDSVPGHEGVHRQLKSSIDKPTKMINLSTLKEKDLDRICSILLLSLRVRKYLDLFQRVSTDTMPHVVGISIAGILRGEFTLISGVSLIDNVLDGQRWLIHTKSEYTGQEINILQEFVNNLLSTEEMKKCIIVYSDNISLGPHLTRLCNQLGISSVNARYSSSILLSSKDEKIRIPRDGLYYQLDDSRLLLMSNGYPDNPDKGVPAPIYVGITNLDSFDAETIFSSLYQSTFLHPSSLSKTKLPVPLYLSEMMRYVRLDDEFLSSWRLKGVII